MNYSVLASYLPSVTISLSFETCEYYCHSDAMHYDVQQVNCFFICLMRLLVNLDHCRCCFSFMHYFFGIMHPKTAVVQIAALIMKILLLCCEMNSNSLSRFGCMQYSQIYEEQAGTFWGRKIAYGRLLMRLERICLSWLNLMSKTTAKSVLKLDLAVGLSSVSPQPFPFRDPCT